MKINKIMVVFNIIVLALLTFVIVSVEKRVDNIENFIMVERRQCIDFGMFTE